MGENVYTLIARVVNGTPITPAQTLEVVEHLQGIINKKNDVIERIRAVQLEISREFGVPV